MKTLGTSSQHKTENCTFRACKQHLANVDSKPNPKSQYSKHSNQYSEISHSCNRLPKFATVANMLTKVENKIREKNFTTIYSPDLDWNRARQVGVPHATKIPHLFLGPHRHHFASDQLFFCMTVLRIIYF